MQPHYVVAAGRVGDGIEVAGERLDTCVVRQLALVDGNEASPPVAALLIDELVVQDPRITSYNVCYTKLLRG